MPLFICDKCNCVDNTALGHYWGREYTEWEENNSDLNGLALCYECMPTKFIDGSGNDEKSHGEGWHDRFPKQHVDEHLKEYPDEELMNYRT